MEPSAGASSRPLAAPRRARDPRGDAEPALRDPPRQAGLQVRSGPLHPVTDGSGELLHGHNFRVRVTVRGHETDDHGLLLDVAAAKARIRAVCDELDEHTLIPEKSPLLEIVPEGDSVEVALGDRRYRLPKDDVTLLPLANVTIELLARMLWDHIAPALSGPALHSLAVAVEETDGQSCTYEAPIP